MKKLTYLIVIFLITATGYAQGHFEVAFKGNGQDHMNIYLVTATIGGVALEAGDEIAAFDGTICCGKVILMQPINIKDNNTFIDIKASRKDEGLSNGYTLGNPITYKYWDSDKNIEISGITAVYFAPSTGLATQPPTYALSGSAFVKLSDDSTVNYALNSSEKESILKLNLEISIPTGIDKFTEDADIKIYPNPSSGKIQLKFANTPSAGTWITAFDVTGKRIYKTLALNEEEYINLTGNPSGLYFIMIDQKIPKTYKIVLE